MVKTKQAQKKIHKLDELLPATQHHMRFLDRTKKKEDIKVGEKKILSLSANDMNAT